MSPQPQTARPPKPKRPNPISTAITKWLASLPQPTIDSITQYLDASPGQSQREDLARTLVLSAPKGWVVYHPLLLFPAGSFAGPAWDGVLGDEATVAALWVAVLREVGAATGGEGRGLTHVGVNEGIPPAVATGEGEGKEDNVVRRPEGLRMLYGDFGPLVRGARPSERDFEEAFWVTTRQNGIAQTWAPRYTMFSRGNVKEKARLLGFHHAREGEGERRRVREGWAVDLYAGIGYFAFSYAKMGMRVLCWEVNPWSVEALRRGAGMNGWGVKVVQGSELERDTGEVVFGGGGEERIVVFLEDNRRAGLRVEQLRGRRGAADRGRREELDVVHVNCGLLPYSTATWKDALAVVGPAAHGWLHLHENVGVADIDSRQEEIDGIFDGWVGDEGRGREAVVEHVERVKTYAPGVWHCVFDVHVTAPKTET
ncbi:hypothetical protein CONLIGDRAFT_448286 [Coniochaeta ligniaria NRRL 30616]|uniref:tRNA wybutosine-synthesizing protein 2 n=1 Tax=Coniochaeta ligniaria NRRL 30616 TaxID=1408157 RepID=A0A1J7JDC7_9PEZI|nr:hypothetical protein CONLIGDRAFT_448286 [Coniochaeta ligniaria NRRL 30616]